MKAASKATGRWQRTAAPARAKAQSKAGAGWLRPASDDELHKLDMESARKRRCLDVTIAALTVPAGHSTSTTPSGAYAVNGMDRERIKQRLRSGACACQKQCHTRLNFRQVTTMCDLYWKLTEEERMFLIHTLYRLADSEAATDVAAHTAEAEDSASSGQDDAISGRTQWSMAGTEVCFNAFCSLMGVTQRTLRRYCRGVLDMRRSIPGSEAQCRAAVDGPSLRCDWFLLELYMTAAEPLPHEEYVNGRVDDNIEVDDSVWLATTSEKSRASDSLPDVGQQLADWSADKHFTQHALLLAGEGSTALRGVPRRYLPHGRVHDLYWQFLATLEVKAGLSQGALEAPDMLQTSEKSRKLTAPSWSTFLRRWHAKWKYILRFRKKSQHADCNICFKLREKVHGKVALAQKLQFAREWRAHLRWQYYDRCLYWSHRYASRSRGAGILTIIVDSMDKCKTVMPKYRFSQKSKEVDKFVRPRVVLTAALAHGYCGSVWLADEALPHGASSCMEVVSQTIEKVYQRCQRDNLLFPSHLVLQSDNTTSQCKNNDFNVWLSTLVARYHFRTCDLHFLTEGHTHEDIDQLFAVILELVLRKHYWETPEELAKMIADVMSEKFAERDEEFFCQVLQGVRDFGSTLRPLAVQLSGAFKARKDSKGDVLWTPHAFSYKRRADLLVEEKKALPPSTSQGSPDDIFCMVKSYMHDHALQQPPVLVLPADRFGRLLDISPISLCLREDVQTSRKEQLMQLAEMLEKPDYNYPRAAAYIKGLVTAQPGRATQLPRLSWLHRRLTAPAPADLPVPDSNNPYFSHLPEIPWNLLATFKGMAGQRPA